jgi:hypothetical protein
MAKYPLPKVFGVTLPDRHEFLVTVEDWPNYIALFKGLGFVVEVSGEVIGEADSRSATVTWPGGVTFTVKPAGEVVSLPDHDVPRIELKVGHPLLAASMVDTWLFDGNCDPDRNLFTYTLVVGPGQSSLIEVPEGCRLLDTRTSADFDLLFVHNDQPTVLSDPA